MSKNDNVTWIPANPPINSKGINDRAAANSSVNIRERQTMIVPPPPPFEVERIEVPKTARRNFGPGPNMGNFRRTK